MAKQSKKVRGEIQREGRRVDTEHTDFLNQLRDRMGGARERGDQLYNEALTGYRGVLNRPTNRPDFSGYEGRFNRFADTGGGLTDENRRRIRGGGVFDEAAKTGLLSDVDKSTLRARGLGNVGGFYKAIRDKLGNQARIGGGGPAFTGSMARLAREQSRASNESALGTESDILGRTISGRQWGAEGMSGAERDLAGLESANRRFGLSGALDAARAGGDFDYRNAGLNLDTLNAMRGLRSDVPGEDFELLDKYLGGIGQRGQLSHGNIGQRMQYDPNVSWFDRLMRIWGQMSDNARTASRAGAGG